MLKKAASDGEPFALWKDLLAFLNFEIQPDGNHFDATDGRASLCVQVTKPDYQEPGFHRKRTGLGHIHAAHLPGDDPALILDLPLQRTQ